LTSSLKLNRIKLRPKWRLKRNSRSKFDLRQRGRIFSINRPPPPHRKALTKSPTKTLPHIKLSLSKRKTFKIKTFSSKREERRLNTLSEENKHINEPSASTQRSTLQVKTFSFNEKEMLEDPGRREQAHKHALDPKRLNIQIKTFSFNEKETSEGTRRGEHAPESCPQPQRPDFQVKDQDF